MIRIYAVAASLVLAVSAFSGYAQTIQINPQNKTVAISATDEATATADIAAITVGFEVFGPDSQSTYVHAGNLSKAVLAILKKDGIADESIESAGQGLQRNTSFDEKESSDERAQKQFVFRQSWIVSTDPKAAAAVIRDAIAAGANESGQIEWRLADRKALQAKAAQAALIKARGIASQMAEGMQVKLGALIYASNETPDTRIYFARPSGVGGGAGGGMYSGGGQTVTPVLEIRPQTMREQATVYAVFAIE